MVVARETFSHTLRYTQLSLRSGLLYDLCCAGYADLLKLREDSTKNRRARIIRSGVVLFEKRDQEVDIFKGLVGTLAEVL